MKLLILFIGLFAASATVAQNNVDAVVTKVIEVMGGRDKLLAINTIKKSGNIEFSGQKIPITYYAVNKTAQRTEFTFSGMTGYNILTKDSGYNFIPFQGQTSPENMTAEDVKLSQDNLDLPGVLVDYKKKGYAIDLLENEDIDGVDAIQLKINIAPHKTLYYFIDPSNYYIIRIKNITISNGQQNTYTTDFYNFKKNKDGVLFAYTLDNITYDTIDVNVPIDSKIFRPSK
ncbi:MAG: hypothetical protein ABJA57_11735 [Ginsengibacter sp.]